MLSGSTTRRLNNFDWLRQEISFYEPKTLFHIKKEADQAPYFDHSCTRGLGAAYDYVLEQTRVKNSLKLQEICQIHYLICNKKDIKINHSFIRAGVIKKTNIPMEIETKLNKIVCDYQYGEKHVLFRIFDLHYQMILLQPFDDYNKRCARMVMAWALIENGYRPIAFTKKSDKEAYPNALLKMSQGDTKSYYDYMLKSMQTSQDKIIKQLKASKVR